MNNIYLTGIMGCGKTVIGKRLAQTAKREFIDTDEWIERREGKTIAAIFEGDGEAGFRRAESAVLLAASKSERAVVSCGGGIVILEENVRVMKETGVIIYIKRDIDKILADINTNTRPLLKQGAEKLKEIYEVRRAIYEACCDFVLPNNGRIEDAARVLGEMLGNH